MFSQKYLRQGDGIMAVPAARRTERVFGSNGLGRTKVQSLGKLESMDAEYRPRDDTCLKAFVRFLAQRATAQTTLES